MYDNCEIDKYTTRIVLDKSKIKWKFNEPELGSESYDCGYDYDFKISKFQCYMDLTTKRFTLFVRADSLNENQKKKFESTFGNLERIGFHKLEIENIKYVKDLRSVIKKLISCQ